jgi:hypothetical protein
LALPERLPQPSGGRAFAGAPSVLLAGMSSATRDKKNGCVMVKKFPQLPAVCATTAQTSRRPDL